VYAGRFAGLASRNFNGPHPSTPSGYVTYPDLRRSCIPAPQPPSQLYIIDPNEHDLGVDRALHVFFNNVLISFGVLFELQFFEKLGVFAGVVEHGRLESPT
jgi:hypothetical protein